MSTGARKWECVREERLAHYNVFSVVRRESRSPRTGGIHAFHFLELPDWIVVVPQRSDGMLVMIEQYRPAADAVMLEFPAGTVDEGENPVDAAARELREETGHVARSIEVLAVVRPDPALLANQLTIAAARGCEPGAARDQDDGEDVHTVVISPEEVQRRVLSGEIQHVNAIIPWYFYQLASR